MKKSKLPDTGWWRQILLPPKQVRCLWIRPTRAGKVQIPPHACLSAGCVLWSLSPSTSLLLSSCLDSREAIKLQCVTIKLNNCRKVKGFRDFFHRRTETRVEISQVSFWRHFPPSHTSDMRGVFNVSMHLSYRGMLEEQWFTKTWYMVSWYTTIHNLLWMTRLLILMFALSLIG